MVRCFMVVGLGWLTGYCINIYLECVSMMTPFFYSERYQWHGVQFSTVTTFTHIY